MKHEEPYLQHILEACFKIGRYIEGKNFKSFKKDTLVQDAVIRQMQVIGQAAGLLPMKTRKNLTDVDWVGIIGMRNKLVHEYFGIDLRTVWTAARKDVPALCEAISKLLDERDL